MKHFKKVSNISKLIIRADGGQGIGMGHLMRTLALADYLGQYMDVVYVCNAAYQEGIALLTKRGYIVKAWDDEALLKELAREEADALLTDSYKIDKQYINYVRKHFKTVGYLDDNVLLPYEADFILNQNFGAEELNYTVNKDCELLLGSQYLLMREEFRRANSIDIKACIKNVFITVGGSDNYNFTSQLLAELVNLPFNYHVVIGQSFIHEELLKKQYKKFSNVYLYDTPNMCELMQKCDLAISSCGSTLYELGVLGIPTIGISVADNQIPLAKRMYERGLIYYLGDIKQLDGHVLRQTFIQLNNNETGRRKMSKINQGAFNKDGVKLVASTLLDIIKAKSE